MSHGRNTPSEKREAATKKPKEELQRETKYMGELNSLITHAKMPHQTRKNLMPRSKAREHRPTDNVQYGLKPVILWLNLRYSPETRKGDRGQETAVVSCS